MPTVTHLYHVISGQRVVVDAHIGDAQGGGHAVFLGTELRAQGELSLTGVDLGAAEDVAGQVLVVSSTAVDVRSETDHVSVEVVLNGGVPSPMPITQAADAPPSGTVNFLTVVTFVGDAQ
jgi:hypothetical protein